MREKTTILIIIVLLIFGISTANSQTFESLNNINFKEIFIDIISEDKRLIKIN